MMRRLIVGIALVGVLCGPTLWADRTAQASPTHRFRYAATLVCHERLTLRDARHVALIKYHWTVWGTLTLRYVCGTQLEDVPSTNHLYRYPVTVISRAPMAEDSAAHVKMLQFVRNDGKLKVVYRTLRKGY